MTIYIHFFGLKNLLTIVSMYMYIYMEMSAHFYLKRGFNEGVNCYNQWVFGLVLHIFREKKFLPEFIKK